MIGCSRYVSAVVWLYAVSFVLPATVLAESFAPRSISELNEAFTQAGSNLQDDIIDLGGRSFVLPNELILESDEGHALVLRNGTLSRADGADFFRLLNLLAVPFVVEGGGKAVIIEGVEFQNGYIKNNELTPQGGGALLSDRKTTISDSTFRNNRVVGNSAGGAIMHSQPLDVTKSAFVNNEAIASGENHTTQGGAIALKSGASLFVAHSYFLGNSADEGGAIHAEHNAIGLNITRSAFERNSASMLGGALWSNVGNGEVRVSNASFITNKASMGGGAIYTQSLFADTTLLHLTFWGNQSGEDSGGAIRALVPRDGSNLRLRNSILTNNVGGNCANTELGELEMLDSGHNLVDDQSCGTSENYVLADVATVFAGAFNRYGGFIPALPIAKSGPAGNLVPRDLCLGFDVRDVPRLDNGDSQDEYCDAGAFEYVPLEQIDKDGDKIRNRIDNCVSHSNPLQSDIDNDGVGDSCDIRDDRDSDDDTVLNFRDNCPLTSNFLQSDSNADGIGDACD